MRTLLTDDQFSDQLDQFQGSAFRLEVKPAYSVVGEQYLYARFLAGEQPQVDPDDPYYAAWLDSIADRTSAGVTMSRVRITDTPLTEYQRFLQWGDILNRQAGEEVLYIDRAAALDAGLPAKPEDPDWWLLDDERVMFISHDEHGQRIRAELSTTDADVQYARLMRDLAIRTARKETA